MSNQSQVNSGEITDLRFRTLGTKQNDTDILLQGTEE